MNVDFMLPPYLVITALLTADGQLQIALDADL